MEQILIGLIEKLKTGELNNSSVLTWASPILSFGNLKNSKVATIGLNPSNLEFEDDNKNELTGISRRFHTLNSLEIKNWEGAQSKHYEMILDLNINYFSKNPYDAWFKKLDYIISGTNYSYYFPSQNACHLDLVPYATATKWGDLNSDEKSFLMEQSIDSLGIMIRDSPIEVVVLNGKSVIDAFERKSDLSLIKKPMPNWTLPRKGNNGVMGFAFEGTAKKLGSIDFQKDILVLGFNHNIQSSFGVTKIVNKEIRNWITKIFTKKRL